MAPYQLGDRQYPSKKAAIEEFRRILNSTPDNVPLGHDDFTLVHTLLEDGRHPESVEKIGPGVGDVVVRRNEFGTRGFWLIRADGSEVDFSYVVALNGTPSPKAGVLAALRSEVTDQVTTFWGNNVAALAGGGMTCELCGQAMTVADTHVDHADPTFDAMATRFADVLGGWDQIEVECVGATGRRLADRGNASVWQEYHRQTARLRITHTRCNLTRKRS